MKVSLRNRLIASSIGIFALVACGGGGDDGAGQLSSFQVSPDAMTIKSSTATCDPVKAGDFAIIGGTAPYTVLSPYYELVTFSAAGGASPTDVGTYIVPDRNGQFAIYVTGCFAPAVVTVLDKLKRVAIIKVSYAASGSS